MISPVTGSYSTNPTITISDSLSGAKIYYTIDGSTPTSLAILYSSPWSFPQTQVGTTVVKAIAVMAGYLPSAVSQSTIMLSLPSAVVATAIVNANIAAIAVPSDFLGFSHEWGVAQNIMGQTTTALTRSTGSSWTRFPPPWAGRWFSASAGAVQIFQGRRQQTQWCLSRN
jgi:Chitobiase/beta-hexosaminidase C-terminal domain